MSNSAYIDAILLFGDSITEESSCGSFYQRMAQAYVRKLDVINRGFGGYNTTWALPVFRQIISRKEDREHGKAQRIKLMTIWFGANDATIPGDPQHVDLDKYKNNLLQLVDLVQSPISPFYDTETKVILLTPGPVIYSKRDNPNRAPGDVQKYVQACNEAGKERDIPVVDVFAGVVNAAGGEEDNQLTPFFTDGLHMTPKGYEVVYNEFTKVLEANFPGLGVEAIERRIPDWNDVKENPSVIDRALDRRNRGEL